MRENAINSVTDTTASERIRFGRRGSEQAISEILEHRIVGASRWARSAQHTIAAHAEHDDPLLIEGEQGAGKEFLARLVHECSVRGDRPFVVIPADSLHETVLQAILFEREESLSMAVRTLQHEYVEQARGGTIYLADVGALSSEFRRRVARLVEQPDLEHARRYGLRQHGVRLVFGSSVGLDNAPIRTVRIPPLRERMDDVNVLAEHFATQLCYRLGKEPRVLSASVLATLRAHDWPGNVGELKHVVETMVRRSGPPTLDVSLLPTRFAVEAVHAANPEDPLENGINLHDEVQRFEKSLLHAALERCDGVQTRAAQLLGLKVTTLNSKLSNYAIDASAFKPRRRPA